MTSTRKNVANLLGIGIDAVNMKQAVSACDELIAGCGRGYVCVTGVHGIMEAQSDPAFRKILRQSFLCVPDGMPTVWVGQLQGHRYMQRVYGPDFLLEMCRRSIPSNHRHFLYGGKAGVADRLSAKLQKRFNGLQVVGTYTPPFRSLTDEEENEFITLVKKCKPDIIWVGLSTPKQERFMAHYIGRLETKLMVGVGAAFDIHTGAIKDAPKWVKRSGLQWLHRLVQDPQRLWRRYLLNNPKFLVKLAFQFAGAKQYRLVENVG